MAIETNEKLDQGLEKVDVDALNGAEFNFEEFENGPTKEDFNSAKAILEAKGTITGGSQDDEYTITLEDNKIRIDWDADTYYISDDPDTRADQESFVGTWLSKIK